MSTVRKPQRRAASPQADRFFYGWRDVWQTGRDGRRRQLQVPLTFEDVLHPQEGDHIVNNDLHTDDCAYLQSVFRSVLAAVAGALVLSDTGVYWDDRSLRHHSPDVAVIFGTRRRRHWPSFDVAVEGVRPTLLVEVTSPSTRQGDLGAKRRQYYRAGVEYYVILDQLPQRREDAPRRLRILGYRRGRRGYERLALNEQGRLWLEPVGVWLGIEVAAEQGMDNERAVCYDRAGRRFLTSLEERQARAGAEERVRQLEEELRRRNGH